MFDFPRDIQPILDRHCVKCHNYERPDGDILLVGDRGPIYSHGYDTLMTKRLVSHGRDASGNHAPRDIGSSASRLMTLLDGKHYNAKLTDHEIEMVRLWIDCGAPYAGTYAALGTGMARMEVPKETYQARCASCHTDAIKNVHEDLLFNLSSPKNSLALLAPLARQAGGYGKCGTSSNANSAAADAFSRYGRSGLSTNPRGRGKREEAVGYDQAVRHARLPAESALRPRDAALRHPVGGLRSGNGPRRCLRPGPGVLAIALASAVRTVASHLLRPGVFAS